MSKNILMVITSNDKLGDSGQQTGWYLPEAVHPYEVFNAAGFSTTFASIQGGHAPCDNSSIEAYKEDKECMNFISNSHTKSLVENTIPVSSIDPNNFDAVFFVGGFGVMWDFPDDQSIQRITRHIYENGGVVSGVCHGPIALANVKLSDGRYLVEGKRVTAFTNDEEDIMKGRSVVPFTCEDKLSSRGAKFDKSDAFQCKVCTDGKLVTGQNPQSAKETANEVVKALGEFAK